MHENIRLFSKDLNKRNYGNKTPDMSMSPEAMELRKQISEYSALEEKYKKKLEDKGNAAPEESNDLAPEEYMDLVLEKTEDIIRIINKETEKQLENIIQSIEILEDETDKKINEIEEKINKKKHVISMLQRLINSINEDTEKMEYMKENFTTRNFDNQEFNNTAKKIREIYNRIEEISSTS